MSDWTGWAAAILSFLLTIVGINYRMDKKRYEENSKECALRDAALAERIAIVETMLMTMSQIQKDLQDIKVTLAVVSKRREDK